MIFAAMNMEKRPELRVSADLPVRIWGMDADGKPFFQNATASNLSSEGALLSDVHHVLKAGEVIGIQYGDRKSRFEVKWVNAADRGIFEVGIRVLSGQVVPWADVTAENRSAARLSPTTSDKRRFVRHKVAFPITIGFEDTHRSHMQCAATDIGGRGCYVETLLPLATGTEVIITFWIDSVKMRTSGIVRASDPGVGMGIEFTALEMQIQQRLQEYLEKIDKGFAAAAAGQGS